jgi:hypothetical protein
VSFIAIIFTRLKITEYTFVYSLYELPDLFENDPPHQKKKKKRAMEKYLLNP